MTKPGRKRVAELQAWMERYNLPESHIRRDLPDSLLNQLSHCKTEECRRIILGISIQDHSVEAAG